MKLLILAAVVVAVHGFGMSEEKMAMKHWTMMKAMESCFGEDVMKQKMIKMKKAAAKCSGIDAPELELPMFDNPYRVVSMLTEPPQEGDDNFGRIMEKYIQMQMLREIGGPRRPRNRDRRFRRDTEDEEDPFSLGERLNKKLMHRKEEMTNKINNMTCVMRECGILDSDNMFDKEAVKKMVNDFELEDEWLKEKIVEGCDMCIQFQEAFPKKYYQECSYGEGLGRAKVFKMCMMKTKLKVCMQRDIKQKLEKNFGPVDTLVKSTGLKEKELFQVVKEMLAGPEKMMM